MSLNIKNDETHRLVAELAALTGESMTQAVTQAVKERLERIKSQRSGALYERLIEIGQDCASHLVEPYKSADHGDILYGEDGLPK